MNIITNPAYTFDDVLLMPKHTSIESRRSVCLKTAYTKHLEINIPIISSNMDTITEWEMLVAMHNLGGRGILHRFMPIDRVIANVSQAHAAGVPTITVSIGVNNNWKSDLERLFNFKDSEFIDSICIDIAHGDCDRTLEVLEFIKKTYPEVDVICGNVATEEATRRLCQHGADAVKVGIGPGSMCTTRIKTGCGVPQLSAIIECVQAADPWEVPVIADGGIRIPADAVKSLAAGASSVMLGGYISGTSETPGDIITIDGIKSKQYRGMASKDAMVGYKGEVPEGIATEGEATIVKYKGPVATVLADMLGGIRSGMTYNDAIDIGSLYENATFRVVTPNAVKENGAHGLNK